MFIFEGPILFACIDHIRTKKCLHDQIWKSSKTEKSQLSFFSNGYYCMKTQDFLKKKSIKM